MDRMDNILAELSTAFETERRALVSRAAQLPGAVREAAEALVRFGRAEGPAVAQIISRAGGKFDRPLATEDVGNRGYWLMIDPDGVPSCASVKRLGPLQWEPEARVRLQFAETAQVVLPAEVLVSFARFVTTNELWTALRKRMG